MNQTSQTSRSGHVSIELAKQLKSAGLVWVPKPKDDFAYEYGNKTSWLYEYYPAVYDYPGRFIWLPTLSQLMAEIEGQGYDIQFQSNKRTPMGRYRFVIFEIINGIIKQFWADTLEDAAALALLWILNRKKEDTQKEIARKEGVPQ